MEIRPITYRQAAAYVTEHHRHHDAAQGCKFCLSLWKEDKLVGVAMCGRPVSRHLDDGQTCEINRVCTDGTKNACSMLYGACCRTAKAMGYKTVITYTLKSEPGTSLKASGFICEGDAGKTHWTGQRDRGQAIPKEIKTRWSKQLQGCQR